jgi:PIN domain nuclease of toxin-antitoxin system
MILKEPGGERVDALLDHLELGSGTQVAMSSVNWCEVLTRMQREKVGLSGEKLSAALSGVDLIPFGKADAEAAASFACVNRALSLGDRACLALAKSLHATAWTTDRIWAQCKVDVPVELIRN